MRKLLRQALLFLFELMIFLPASNLAGGRDDVAASASGGIRLHDFLQKSYLLFHLLEGAASDEFRSQTPAASDDREPATFR